MSRSAGAGSPVWFRCAKCRSVLNPDRRSGGIDRVVLTGRTRPTPHSRYGSRGTRSTAMRREYRCLDCGHVGWSNHIDLQRCLMKVGVSLHGDRE